MLRVGHGGAGALARANTIESFEAAVDAGVDMIEFDVRAHHGELLLAHTPFDARFRQAVRLQQALRHLASPRFAGLLFDVDIKSSGVEAATLYALEAAGLTDRCLVSCRSLSVLDRLRRLDPSVRTGVSIRRPSSRPAVLALLEARRFDAIMAHHRLVDSAFLSAVRERAGELYAWTVDDRRLLDRLRGTDVTGVVTNDPRLFATAG